MDKFSSIYVASHMISTSIYNVFVQLNKHLHATPTVSLSVQFNLILQNNSLLSAEHHKEIGLER